MDKNTENKEFERIELNDDISEKVTGGSVTLDKIRDSEENERQREKITQ